MLRGGALVHLLSAVCSAVCARSGQGRGSGGARGWIEPELMREGFRCSFAADVSPVHHPNAVLSPRRAGQTASPVLNYEGS